MENGTTYEKINHAKKTSGFVRLHKFFEFQKAPYMTALANLERFGCHALLHDMGTGKTMTTLYLYDELLNHGMVDHMVVVAPKMLMETWVDQLNEHLGTTRYLKWKTPVSKAYARELACFDTKHGNVFIINTEAFQSRGTTVADTFLKKLCLNRRVLVVVDESSKIKTHDANRTRNIIDLGGIARFRMILTGTEVTNSVLDLYSQYEFLQHGFWGLKNFYVFRARYAIMVDQYGPGGRTFKKVVGFQQTDELKAKIMTVSTRLKKSDCLDLPAKMYQTIHLEMSKELRDLYDKMKKDLMAEYAGVELTVANKAALFVRFRQLSGGFFPGTHGESAAIKENNKLDALLDDLEDTDQQAIVWACFTAEIDLLSSRLAGIGWTGRLDGTTSQENRNGVVKSFVAGETRFLVANPAVAAYGLNLQCCSLAYWYSAPLSPEQRWQGEDRQHRIGQVNQVLYKDFVYKNSVDERVAQLLKEKTKLREEFREYKSPDAELAAMSKDEFFELF